MKQQLIAVAALQPSSPSNSSGTRRGLREQDRFLRRSERMRNYGCRRHKSCAGDFLESWMERRTGKVTEKSGGLANNLTVAKLFEDGKGGILLSYPNPQIS